MPRKQTLFFEPTHPALARKIKISSLREFVQSIERVKADGYSERDRKALQLAQNRARAQLNRRNLSPEKRLQFMEISRIQIPEVK